MKMTFVEQKERFLFAGVLLVGVLFMLVAGQLALQMPRTWQIGNTNMDSQLNPNEIYALSREDPEIRLAPIRSDIPDLLATAANTNRNQNSFEPPSAVEFKAPTQIATTTPFRLTSPTAVVTASQTADASVTALPTSSETSLPTLLPTQTPQPTSTVTPIPTYTATRTRTPTRIVWPTQTAAPTVIVQPEATNTPTITRSPVPSNTATDTRTPVPTDTATAEFTPTATDTAEPTPTATASTCTISGSNSYLIPAEGCTVLFDTTAQGAIFSLEMIDSGNLSVSWYGLLQNQTVGLCAAQNSNLTPGIRLVNIAVAKNAGSPFKINNTNNKTITIQITVSDWLDGGCQ